MDLRPRSVNRGLRAGCVAVLLGAALMLAGCAKELSVEPAQGNVSTLTADEVKFLAECDKPVKYEPTELDGIVDDAIELLDGDPATRSATGRRVEEITPILGSTDPATRSDETEQEVLYVVNYAGDAGYSVIAADRRLPDQVLISVESGSLDIEQGIDNPGLALMLAGAEEYVRREIAEYEAWADSMEVVVLGRPLEPTIETRILESVETTYGPWTTDAGSKVAPIIPVEWGQGGIDSPYNRFVESNGFSDSYLASLHGGGDYIPAGCVAVASAQLMTYWKFPSSYSGWGGYTYSESLWNKLRQYKSVTSADANTQTRCGLLLSLIGRNVGMEYEPATNGGSFAESQDAIDMLKDMGYSASSKQNYNYNNVKSSLTASRPVYMRGNSTKNSFLGITWYNNGHAWLLDGYLRQTRTVTSYERWRVERVESDGSISIRRENITVQGQPEAREYFHNNFGWTGTANGYYNPGLFNTSTGPDLPSWTRAGDGNYVYNLEMWTNIYPN